MRNLPYRLEPLVMFCLAHQIMYMYTRIQITNLLCAVPIIQYCIVFWFRIIKLTPEILYCLLGL